MKTEAFIEKYKEHLEHGSVCVPEEWLDIIDAGLTAVLSWVRYDNDVPRKAYGDFQIRDIKEKFGSLRLYYVADSPETDNVINGMVMALEGVIDHLYGEPV